jgi:hypothetical protein
MFSQAAKATVNHEIDLAVFIDYCLTSWETQVCYLYIGL